MDAPAAQAPTTAELAAHFAGFDRVALRERFAAQNEFLAVENFLPADLLDACLATLPALAGSVNRNFIPGHKQGGSISRFDLDQLAPVFGALYRDPDLNQWLRDITGVPLQHCPAGDPHTYALYYYTQAGDHVGYHYDTSYYRGCRYTLLLGLVDESGCRLEAQLYRDLPDRQTESWSAALKPGMLVVFNGDKVWHRVTPAAAGDRRIALTLEYLTDIRMHPFRRFMSNMKDAIAYFGFRQVFGKR